MKKKLTLFIAACSFSAIPVLAQVSTQTDNDIVLDSLAGFQVDVALQQCGEASDPVEANNQIELAKRNYIDQKFHLGKYSAGYTPPNLKQNNPSYPDVACDNVDFELGDFTGWAGAIGDNTVSSLGPLQSQTPGIFTMGLNAALSNSSARHTIVSNAFGPDPYGGFPVVPTGGGIYAARMGGTTPNYQGEILEQTFIVGPNSTSFAYQYACVLWSGGHQPSWQPYMRIEVLDPSGQPINSCTQLYVVAGTSATINGFFQYAPDTTIYYKPWTTVNFDLSAYLNQQVTVRFTVAGCTQSGHWGYAYVDCACSSLAAQVHFCPGNTQLILTAPTGYGSYQWLDPNHTPINGATNDTLIVSNPTVGDTFYVYLVSSVDTSCHNTLPVALEYTHIFPNATATPASCWRFSDGTLAASATMGIPPYTYAWNTTPPASTANVTNVPPGTYIVNLTDSLGCTDFDTVTVNEPARLDTSNIIYDFCPGDPDIKLIAPSGYQNYTWIGPNSDTLAYLSSSNTITVTGPQIGAEYMCVLWSPPACPIYDSIILNLNPPVNFFNPDTTVNVFTPNGDMKNDFFYPYYDQTVANQTSTTNSTPAYDFRYLYIDVYEIWIYDRWGNQVFYSNDYNIGWDGKAHGKDCTEGVYYWVTKMTSRCKPGMAPIENHGFVHVIR
ncbi:MAG: gliding motility-associated C-terminal domain-containing protein [Bacteroidetes bacterium]|nr:gliding motility-associated C-terminal domain-containing protein [Bacteroidota bacterium]